MLPSATVRSGFRKARRKTLPAAGGAGAAVGVPAGAGADGAGADGEEPVDPVRRTAGWAAQPAPSTRRAATAALNAARDVLTSLRHRQRAIGCFTGKKWFRPMQE